MQHIKKGSCVATAALLLYQVVILLFGFFLFSFGFSLGFGEFCFVGKRYIAFHCPVIQRVNGAFFQITEEAVHIYHPANAEPESGDKCHDPGDQQCGDKEIVSPPLLLFALQEKLLLNLFYLTTTRLVFLVKET